MRIIIMYQLEIGQSRENSQHSLFPGSNYNFVISVPGTNDVNIFPSASGYLYLVDSDIDYAIRGIISATDEDGAGLGCSEIYFASPLKGIEIYDEPIFGGYIHGEKSWNIAIDGINNNNPPNAIIDVSPSNTVESGTTVTLDGSRSNDPDIGDEIISYKWEQIEGPPVDLMPVISTSQLNEVSSKIVNFTAPSDITENTRLKFRLTVTDTFGASSGPETSINVKPIILEVEVAPSEINPYPTNINLPQPKSQIKITAKQSDGIPVPFTDITVETCSILGTKDSDGHIHNQMTDETCHQSQRPKAIVSDGTNTSNPLSVTTDSNGTITLDYVPPSSEIDGKKYYISGKDKIVASLKNNLDVKNDTETITTKIHRFDTDAKFR